MMNCGTVYTRIAGRVINIFPHRDLPLSDATKRGLKDSGYKDPTEIQKESIGKYSEATALKAE